VIRGSATRSPRLLARAARSSVSSRPMLAAITAVVSLRSGLVGSMGAFCKGASRCREDHPAVVRVQPAAKWHMEFADRDLSVMEFSLHLQRSPVVAIVDCSVRGQFSRP
jgi:hypothetical protein